MDEPAMDKVAIEFLKTARWVILTLICCITLYNIMTSDHVTSFSSRPSITQPTVDMPPLRK